MKKNRIFKIIFFAWTFIWLLFLVRGLIKGEARQYRDLFGKSLTEKQAYVSGEEFYAFIEFCKKVIPERAYYRLEAKYDDSMDYFRFPYYMYPALRDLDDPEYIVCYKVKFLSAGYEPIASLSTDKYILKKTR